MITPSIRLLAVAGLVLSAPAFAEEWSKRWKVSQKPELKVNVDDGRLVVRSGPSGEISATVFVKGWRIGNGEVTISERQPEQGRVELEVRVPRAERWFSTGNQSVRVELIVPQELNAQMRTGDGAIRVDGLKGSIRLKTGDGAIEVLSCEGALNADTGDGAIKARGVFNTLNLTTGDGSIEAEVQAGSKMANPWDIHTGDGHITLRLPQEFSAELDIHTGDGRVDVELPVTASKMRSGQDVRGRLGAGGPMLRVRTGDGPIRLARQ